MALLRDGLTLAEFRDSDVKPLQADEYTGKEKALVVTSQGYPATVPLSPLGFVSRGRIRVTVTPAQLAALSTTPITIIPAITDPTLLGMYNMKQWLIVMVWFSNIAGTGSTPWTLTAGTAVSIRLGGTAFPLCADTVMVGVLDQGGLGNFRTSPGHVNSWAPQGVASNIQLYQSVGSAMTGGTQALQIDIVYGVMDNYGRIAP